MLEVTNLACARGDRPLFHGLSFALRPGGLLHIVGANGSGKTTLLRALCGLTRPATGEIRWQGEDIHALGDDYRRALAYVGHSNGIQGELTLRENLRVAACLSGRAATEDADRTLDGVALSSYRAFPAKILSQGQQRRLALARLAVARKALWILDEPFSALDARSTEVMTGLLSAHLASGGLIVLTSHQDLAIELETVLRIRLDS